MFVSMYVAAQLRYSLYTSFPSFSSEGGGSNGGLCLPASVFIFES